MSLNLNKSLAKKLTSLGLFSYFFIISAFSVSTHAEIRFFTNDIELEDEIPKIKNLYLKLTNYLKNIELSKSTPLHKELFGDDDLNGAGYEKILSQVQSVAYINSNKNSALASAPFNKVPLMTINKNFPLRDEAAHFVLAFSVILHEAWHLDLGSHKPSPHAVCKGQFFLEDETLSHLLNKRGCDNKLRGAYIAQIVMLHNISRYCTNCSKEIIHEAALLSNELRARALSTKLKLILSDDLDNNGMMTVAPKLN